MRRIWDAIIEYAASVFQTKAKNSQLESKQLESGAELRANFVELVDTLQKLLLQAEERLQKCQAVCLQLMEAKGRIRPPKA